MQAVGFDRSDSQPCAITKSRFCYTRHKIWKAVLPLVRRPRLSTVLPATVSSQQPAKKGDMANEGAIMRFQGVDKSSTAYKLLASMGWQEGQGLVVHYS